MEGFCRGCLNKYDEPTDLLQYCERNRRMYVYSTGIQVKRNDIFAFQLCKECYLNMKLSCKFKKRCRSSDKKFKNYLALKEEGDNFDFSTYLKNFEDNLTLRLPIGSGSSTPAQKNKEDDDNESTCTSIRNFMTDILQGEEVPDTEARIIREVIEEEADVLDDSLDSHWLQDDMSVNSDLEMGFKLFSTPHSIQNDHCYTPRKLKDQKEQEINYYTSKEINERPDKTETAHLNDMPILDDYSIEFGDVSASNISIGDLNTGYSIENIEGLEKHKSVIPDIQHKDFFDSNKVIEMTIENSIPTVERTKDTPFINNDSNDFIMNDEIQDFIAPTANEHDISIVLQNKAEDHNTIDELPLIKEFNYYINNVKLKENLGIESNQCDQSNLNKQSINENSTENKFCVTLNQKISEAVKIDESPLDHELEYYMSKAELNKKNKTKQNELVKKDRKVEDSSISDVVCSIDRNLELALKNDDYKEFALEQLLLSPRANARSGASTPTIRNILFGGMTPKHELKDQNRDFNVTEILEKFFKDVNNKQKRIGLKDIQKLRELLKFNDDDGKTSESTENESESVIDEQINTEVQKINGKSSMKIESNYQVPNKNQKDAKEISEKLVQNNNINQKTYKGKKDIRKLKELLKDNNDYNKLDDSTENESESVSDEQIDVEVKKIESKKNIISEDAEIEALNERLSPSLLDIEDNHMDDSNISISSDFLKDPEKLDLRDLERKNQSNDLNIINIDSVLSNFLRDSENPDLEHQDDNNPQIEDFLEIPFSPLDNKFGVNTDALEDKNDLFKRPFSPPDNKYDMNECFCKICKKTFNSAKSLRIHFAKKHKIKINSAPKKFLKDVAKLCELCGKSLRDYANFNRHMKMHQEFGKTHECKFCTLSFATAGRLTLHMKAHPGKVKIESKGKEDKKYVCSTCGRVFATKSNFIIHLRRHTQSYTHTCEICQKGFYRRNDLNLHLRCHLGSQLLLACNICPKKYTRRESLYKHLLRHKEKTNFECDICNMKFVSKHILKNHFKNKSCMQKRDNLASKETKTQYAVSVIDAVGSSEKIKEIMENKNLKETTEETDESQEIKEIEMNIDAVINEKHSESANGIRRDYGDE